MKAMLAALLMALLTADAAAYSKTRGSTMLRGCQGFANMADGADPGLDSVGLMLVGECIGTTNTLWLTLSAESVLCTPEEVRTGQLIRAIVKHLQDNPKRLHENGITLATEALIDAFPCPGGR